MIALLDTNILIASGKTPDLSGFDDLMISSLSFSELRMGIAACTQVSQYRQREARLAQISAVYGDGVSYDDAVGASYGRIVNLVADRGGQPKARRFDRMIAATALCHGFTLVTRNINDFRDIQDLVDVVER